MGWGAGARALGMGRAFVAVSDDASAGYWNPAGLAKLQHTHVTGLHALLWEGATYSFVGVAFPTLTHGTFGFNGTLLRVGDIERRNAVNDVVPGMFESVKSAFAVSYGLSCSGQWQMGVTVKHIGRWLDGGHSGFVSADGGVLVAPLSWVTAGLSVKNLSAVRYNTLDDLPMSVQAGLAVKGWDDAVLVTAALDQSGRWNAGAEVQVASPLLFRLGAGAWETTAGLGIHWEDVVLDYSGGLHRELGFSHRFSVSWRLGESLALTREALAKQTFDRAFEAFERGDHPAAEQFLNDVLALDPDHRSASYLLNKVKR